MSKVREVLLKLESAGLGDLFKKSTFNPQEVHIFEDKDSYSLYASYPINKRKDTMYLEFIPDDEELNIEGLVIEDRLGYDITEQFLDKIKLDVKEKDEATIIKAGEAILGKKEFTDFVNHLVKAFVG